ncbi:hypothetical protein POTOM_027213 [Populus tomentosa]|uniref:Uncharacterized protein n=1 Tax=Populus tomentosa TaxID=118781 RepID=A0A8X8CMD3_POPTO|nr:hypothetical protein POTOM_027213 [Populus tomentosa]
MALSSAFARTLSFLYQSVQNPQGSDDSSSTIGLHLEKQRPRSAGFEEADDVVAEKLAQELLWITNKLRDYGAVDEALLQYWSYASGLASLALSTANPRVQVLGYKSAIISVLAIAASICVSFSFGQCMALQWLFLMQFNNTPGFMEGTPKPNYVACVIVPIKASTEEMSSI